MRWQASGLPVAATPGMAPKQTRAARGRPVERGPVVGAGWPEPSPRPPAPMLLGLMPPAPAARGRALGTAAHGDQAADAAADRSPVPDCAATSAGRATPAAPTPADASTNSVITATTKAAGSSVTPGWKRTAAKASPRPPALGQGRAR